MKFLSIAGILIFASARLEQSLKKSGNLNDMAAWALLSIAVALAVFGGVIASSKLSQLLVFALVIFFVLFKQRDLSIRLGEYPKIPGDLNDWMPWITLSVAVALFAPHDIIKHQKIVQLAAFFAAILLFAAKQRKRTKNNISPVNFSKNMVPLLIKIGALPFLLMALFEISSNTTYPLNTIFVSGMIVVFIAIKWISDRADQDR
ncbi:MAG: hypothetical protein U1C54_07885 [Xanthomonadaceae bacterium]|nr:hypothetical protein [Xanthomonadaceae bacterium]MDZ4262260.1 hypothetical protein [Pseudomonadota bacterium]